MAQHRAQTAEQRASSALSGVKAVADRTRHAQSVAEAAIAEARSVRNEVLAKIAAFTKCADDSMSNAVGILTGRMEEVSTQTEVQASRVAADVTQQLGKEFEAAATSAAATAMEIVEGIRHDV